MLNCINSGIKHGIHSGTKFPEINVDSKKNISFVDCPGSNDTRGSEQEIINAISIKEIIENTTNQDVEVKIILVAQGSDFLTQRNNYAYKEFERIINMFPNDKSICKKMGLIITKVSKDYSQEKYIKKKSKMSKYFSDDRIFMFPEPSKESGIYDDFEDEQNLINFIMNDKYFIKNPKASVQLNKDALFLMDKTKQHLINSLNKQIENYFLNYQKQCYKSTINKINDHLDHLLYLKSNQNIINNINDFIRLCHQNKNLNENLREHLNIIENYHSIISFVQEILGTEEIIDNFKDKINSSLRNSIDYAQSQRDLEITKQEINKNFNMQIAADSWMALAQTLATVATLGIGVGLSKCPKVMNSKFGREFVGELLKQVTRH